MKEGLVKYNNFVFWWKADGSKYRRWWRFRRAYKDGALDFYMSTTLIIGGFILLYGLYRGNKKRGKYTY